MRDGLGMRGHRTAAPHGGVWEGAPGAQLLPATVPRAHCKLGLLLETHKTQAVQAETAQLPQKTCDASFFGLRAVQWASGRSQETEGVAGRQWPCLSSGPSSRRELLRVSCGRALPALEPCRTHMGLFPDATFSDAGQLCQNPGLWLLGNASFCAKLPNSWLSAPWGEVLACPHTGPTACPRLRHTHTHAHARTHPLSCPHRNSALAMPTPCPTPCPHPP